MSFPLGYVKTPRCSTIVCETSSIFFFFLVNQVDIKNDILHYHKQSWIEIKI